MSFTVTRLEPFTYTFQRIGKARLFCDTDLLLDIWDDGAKCFECGDPIWYGDVYHIATSGKGQRPICGICAETHRRDV